MQYIFLQKTVIAFFPPQEYGFAMRKTVRKTQTKPARATTISLRLQANHLEQLAKLASQTGTTRSALIQIAVARLLKDGVH